VPRVAWASLPPLPGGLFWQKISEVVLSGNTLVEVVSSVKNSRAGRSMRPSLASMGEDNVRTWVGPVIAISGRLNATWRVVVHRIGCDPTNYDPEVACDADSG
jgi:hypothetical protein